MNGEFNSGTFYDEGTLINFTGKAANSRTEVEKMLTEDHQGFLKEISGRAEVKSLQFVSRNVALLDEDVEMNGWKNPDGKVAEEAPHFETVITGN